MKIPRCYTPQSLTPGQPIDLLPEIAHHLANVLRLRVDNDLILFNGQGGEYQARLTRLGKKHAQALVGQHRDIDRESPLNISLAQGISRGQKMDYTIQKAVELGIQRIVPILNKRSSVRLSDDRKLKKQEHWQKIIIAACEQSGRNRIPLLDLTTGFSEWVEHDKNPVKILLDPMAEKRLSDVSVSGNRMTLLIGSEGGFDMDEISRAEACAYTRVQLGTRVLRTETAAVVAIGICQSLWGDI